MIWFESEWILNEFIGNIRIENVYDYEEVNEEFDDKWRLEASYEEYKRTNKHWHYLVLCIKQYWKFQGLGLWHIWEITNGQERK